MHWEDLLNLFFGELADDDTRRTVEFHKDPHNIDEAVDHVLYYHETGRHAKASDEKHWQNARATRAEPDYLDRKTSSSDDDSRVAQVSDLQMFKSNWHSKKNRASGQCTSTEVIQEATGAQQNLSPLETEQMLQISKLQEQVAKFTQKQANNSKNGGNQ